MPQDKKKHVAILPARLPDNVFVDNFSDSLVHSGLAVQEFDWKRFPTAGTVILHWPNEFFLAGGAFHAIKCAIKLSLMRLYQRLGIRFVWVAHNARPHEADSASGAIATLFVNSLDGVVFLSSFSREALSDSYSFSPTVKILQTVHGNYRRNSFRPVAPPPALTSEVRLLTFGQIRPYKNIETLAEAVTKLKSCDIHLTIAGRGEDPELLAHIGSIAARSERITLDIRSAVIPGPELEGLIDAAHGVVLSYRSILNSGSAFHALSRNRPILAPRIGSLPELRDQVGRDWVMLYDDEISENAIREFSQWLRSRDPTQTCDLSSFEWDLIGESLANFVGGLHGSRQ